MPAPRRLNIVPDLQRGRQGHRPGAARAAGRLDAFALRVPVPTGSVTDLTVTPSRNTSVQEIKEAYAAAAAGPYKGLLSYTEAPLVSSDIVNDPASCVFDAELTRVTGSQVKVVGWYDNEWGYSNRLIDLALLVGSSL